MLHYNENNFETIEYVSKQAKKYLEQIALYHEPEKLFLKTINEIVNTIDKKERKEKLTFFYSQISQFQLSISGNAINKFIVDWVKEIC